MKQQLTAVVIGSDAESKRQVLDTFKSFTGEVRVVADAAQLPDVMGAVQSVSPDIVVLEVKELERGAREIEALLLQSPRSAVFVVSAESSSQWILRLIRSGAREYLTRPVSSSELLDAVQKVARQHAPQGIQSGKKGGVISVYNPNAGMGTTTIAVNLAATLAAQGHNTALVDLNFISRDVSAFLDLTPRYTLENVLPKKGLVDSSFLKSIIVPHSSGVQVLDGPENLLDGNRISPELLQEVITVLRTVYDYTVLDTGGQLFGCNLAAFSRSDRVLFTTVLSIPALRNAKRYLTALEDEGYGAGRVKLLVNRHVPKDDIKVSEAEKVLRAKTYQILPNCYAEVKNSINKGVPLMRCHPKSTFARGIEELVARLTRDISDNGRLPL